MPRVLIALGVMVGFGFSLVTINRSTPTAVTSMGVVEKGTTTTGVIAATVPIETEDRATPVIDDPPNAPRSDADAAPAPSLAVAPELPDLSFDGLLRRAIASGAPNAPGATVVASSCHGDVERSHWGYFNNGATGGTVIEPNGAVVPLGAICLNPSQPDPYSSLVHELGHKWFWETGTWTAGASTFGSTERAAECFARVFGATVFGSGGCPDSLLSVMESIVRR